MSKTLILCEKPSQAADFSKGLGEQFKKENNYYESSGYIICNARGHLIELASPEEYDEGLKSWSMETLPIIPKEFKYKIAEKNDLDKLFHQISKLLNRDDVKKIIIATDAEREGELIARLILKQAGITENSGKELYRFWTSGALDSGEIKRTMGNLKPLSSYDRLYHAALARQQADWLIGINGTRAASIKAGGSGKAGVVSIGRVQTPTLYILALRSRAITNFIPKTYYELECLFRLTDGQYKGKLSDDNEKVRSFETKEELENLITSIEGSQGQVIFFEKKIKSEPHPKLYSLSGVQKEANERYGIKASESLEILQSLYDKKFTTYPRSGSEVLEEQMVEIAEKTLHMLSHTGIDLSRCKVEGSDKRVFNNKELTDHHAIIPTGHKPCGLTDNEKKIYDMVAKRFIAAFSPNYIYEATEIKTKIAESVFRTLGNRTVDLGWKAVLGISEQEDSLPIIKVDDITETTLIPQSKETAPPRHYTDGTLLADMESAHKFVKNEELKKMLKENAGIGTPATQANIIETLVKRGTAERKGKNIIITRKGLKLIEQMENEQVCDPAYTAMWESALEDIASGRMGPETFMESTKDATKYLVESIKNKNFTGISKSQQVASVGKCPVCKCEVVEFSKGYSCLQKDVCKFVLWKNKLSFAGKAQISAKEAKGILNAYQEGHGYEIKLKSKAGKEYTAFISLGLHPKYGWGLEILRND